MRRPTSERAALGGSGDAAAYLGATFDDEWLWKVGALGVGGDPDKARYWYDEAGRMGSRELARIIAPPATLTPRR